MSVIAMPSRVPTASPSHVEPTHLDAVSEPKPGAIAADPNAKGAAREAFMWLRQVARDPALPLLSLRVAIEVSQHVDRRKGYAHPSHETLAADLKASRRGVQKALGKLQEQGHLDVQVSRGAGQANRYRLRVWRMARGAV
ncbi:helix-turn-helix domain-containing protein [Methylobacterium sp. J-090]|uniref:helix-turn-helix domain-containing protein n=1 Tax=Methylobacterium sp. J-090 TaxID=2836666 RepID=UPI001FBA3594|nr:helix-turn-helix domain-containing protein [Methylobacterium sp. J-090]MCJ2083221.1 helix-turn-helix domain-containing protein [Methylobacterium sp. J-090]